MKRIRGYMIFFVVVGILVSLFSTLAFAKSNKVYEEYKKTLAQFQKTVVYRGKRARISITVTYYSAKLVDAIVNWEAEKHLWTEDEAENYKYQLLKTLHFEDMLPFKISIDNRGPSMHPAPFGSKVTLWIDSKSYKPKKYDLRFNFKIIGKREGMVFFARRGKNGKPIIKPSSSLMQIVIDSSISPVTSGRNFDFTFKWGHPYENLEALAKADIARARLEIDRLMRRIQRLTDKKKELLEQLKKIEQEIEMIKKRISELESVKEK